MLSRTTLRCLQGSLVRIRPAAQRCQSSITDGNASTADAPIAVAPGAQDRPDSSTRTIPDELDMHEDAKSAAAIPKKPIRLQNAAGPTHHFTPRPGALGNPTGLDYEKIITHLAVNKTPRDQFNADFLAFELFKEMLDHKIPPSLQVLNQVLHLACEGADSDRVSWILDIFKTHWITLESRQYTQIAHHFANTGQFELGLAFLEKEQKVVGKKIPTQAYSGILRGMLRRSELDGALEVLRIVDGPSPEGPSRPKASFVTFAWNHEDCFRALVAFADAEHAQGLEYAWRQSAIIRDMDLDLQLCQQILSVTARQGMPLLATDVLKYMSGRKMTIGEQDYTDLIAAYTRAGDIKVAFSVLSVMRNAGAVPSDTTTSTILRVISRDLDTVDRAWFTLLDLKQSGSTVDIAAVNCIIQACVLRHDLSRAMATYKESIASVTDEGLGLKPDVLTLNNLLLGCCAVLEHQVALQLVTEFRDMHQIKANAETFENLICCVLLQPEYEAAFAYLEEMKEEGHQPSAALYKMLVLKLVAQGDERARVALDEMKGWGYRNRDLERTVHDGGVLRNSDVRQQGQDDGSVLARKQQLRAPEITLRLVAGYQRLRDQVRYGGSRQGR